MIKLYVRRMNDINIEGELAVAVNIILCFFMWVFYINMVKFGNTFEGMSSYVILYGLGLLFLISFVVPFIIKGSPNANQFGPAPQD